MREADAVRAEDLMRSRYTAFAKRLTQYVVYSWDPATLPEDLSFRDGLTWTGLEIVATELGGPDDDTGVVEFIATHEHAGHRGRLHERSRFVRHDGRWVYLDGDQIRRRRSPSTSTTPDI